MRNNRSAFIPALFVAILFALVCLALLLGKGQPVYQGRKLSAWLEDIDYGQPEAKRQKAYEAIRIMGTNTLPFLLDDLNPARASRLREYLVEFAKKHPELHLKWRSFDDLSRQATWAFKSLGSAGSPAIPDLLKLEESNPGYVPEALGRIGVAALPFLIQGLTNKNEWVRENVASYLASAISDRSIPESEARIAIPFLVRSLGDTNNSVRLSAAKALKNIDEAATRAYVQ